MPEVARSTVKSDLETAAPGSAIPTSLIDPFLSMIDGAGYGLVERATGDRAVVTDTTPGVRYRVTGVPGVFLCGCGLGERGWLVWLEFWQGGAPASRSSPVFLEGGTSPLDSGLL